MDALEKRIMKLEDIEAIRKLKALYCHLVDEGISGNMAKIDELMTHFVGDAWIDFGQADAPDIHEGRQAITRFYKEYVCEVLSYSMHIVANPVIEVNGDEAVCRWYVFVPCMMRQTNSAVWLAGKYKEEYLKVNGQWKWLSMTFRAEIQTPFEGSGWGATAPNK
jgi:hypothetical protein